MLLILSSLGSYSQSIPKRPEPARLVNDMVGLFKPEEVNALEQKLIALDDSTSIQIAVVVLPELYGYDANSLAQQIGEQWGVGMKGKNNGIVILIKPKNGNEKGFATIQTGYGMEASVPDAIAKRIVELEMIPEFRQNNFYAGTDKAIDAISLASKGQYKGEPKKQKGNNTGVAIVIIIILIIIISIASKNKNDNHKTMGGSGSSLPFWMLMGMGMSSGGRSSGSGWGDFSSGGGSFGGFGGGSFGGGGASGSW